MNTQSSPLTQPQAEPQKRLSLGLMTLAVASSLIASTCCVIPLLLVLVGIGGAWMTNLTALKPFTPIFVAIALGTLAWAGYLVFRPSRSGDTCSPTGEECDTTCRVTRRAFIGCAVFIAVLLLFPFAAPLFY